MSKVANSEKTESLLVDAAKALGSAAGKLASLAGVSEPAPTANTGKKVAKLEKKHRTRVPRKEKKTRKKAMTAA